MTSDRLHRLADRGLDEFRRLVQHEQAERREEIEKHHQEAVILRKTEISFVAQGFALINAAVLAKVMLIAEALKFGRRFDGLPLIWPIAWKSALFSVLFIVCHGLEEIAVAALAGRPVAHSIPAIGGGTWAGVAFVFAILTVSLLPFFALREIGRLLGEGRLWALMFHRDAGTSSSA